MSGQYLVSLVDVGTDTVFKHVFYQQGVWLITYLEVYIEDTKSTLFIRFSHLLYKLIIYTSYGSKRKAYLEHIVTVDKTKSRMGGLQVV